MAIEAIERDVETLLEIQLRNLGWIDDPRDPRRNVWKQQARSQQEMILLDRLRPDYILYNSHNNSPIIVIEAKRPQKNVETALEEAISYAELIKAPIAIGTNGTFVKAVHVQSRERLILNGNRIGEFFEESIALEFAENHNLQTLKQNVIQTRADLIRVFKESNNLLREEGLQAGHQRFSAFSNILFLKLMSEIQEFNHTHYRTPMLDTHLRWDTFKSYRGQGLIDHINNVILPAFNQFYSVGGQESIFDSLNVRDHRTLKKIIDKLDQLTLINIDSDIKGDAFEFFLKSYNAGEKDLGEYFTPRHIVKFLVQLLNPKYNEKVYDPFCGTGGMLTETYKHLLKFVPKSGDERYVQTVSEIKRNSVFGREISSTAKIAKMNMILIGDGHNNIRRMNSLSEPVNDEYDIVISNIPFSQETEYGNLYQLPSRDANSICIQHCLNAIKSTAENGRLGLIVPEKILFDKKYEALRETIHNSCTISNIISLPSGVFEPYTNVQTSILHLTNVKQNIPADEVRFYFVKNDGYSLDRQRRELAGENDLDKYFMNDEDDLITVNSQEIQNNLFALQGKKYISKEDLARIIFGTDDLLRLSTILTPVRAERVTIEDLDEYELLGVRSYGLGAFKKPLKKGYEISNSMKYYRAKSNHLFWCGVDTKNGAFGVIKQDQNNCVYTSNMKMMKIDDSRVIPYFIEILFRNKKVQEYFDNYISGSTNRKSIKQRELLEFYIPNYSREQQQKIVDKVIKAERNIRNHVSSIEESIEMTNTITVTT